MYKRAGDGKRERRVRASALFSPARLSEKRLFKQRAPRCAAEIRSLRHLGENHTTGRFLNLVLSEIDRACHPPVIDRRHCPAIYSPNVRDRPRSASSICACVTFVLAAAGASAAQSLSELRSAADRGDPDAQFALGGIYKNGQGITRSFPDALLWYRKAAEQGHAPSMINLGYMYSHGEGIPKAASDYCCRSGPIRARRRRADGRP